MIGKKVEYQNPDTTTFSMREGVVMDKILVDGTNYYLIKTSFGEIDTVRCARIKQIN